MTHAVSPLAVALAAGPPLLLLVGEPGSGRQAFLARAAAETGLAVLPLELDGFESDSEDALARYLAARVRTAPELGEAAARLAPLATALPPNRRSALLLAALLAATPTSAALDVPFDPTPALEELLAARLAEVSRLAVFVRAEELTGPVASWLVGLPAELPGLQLVLAMAPGDETALRFWLPAVDADLVPRHEIAPAADGGDALAPLAALFDRLELDVARELEAFLDGAALLAPNAPADVAGFLAGRSGDDAEALLDRVDDELADGAEARVLWDFEYSHPSFPGQPVYRFVQPELARAIRDRRTPEDRRQRAREAFERLAPKLPADSRGRTRLLLGLARTAGLEGPRRRLLAELALAGDATETSDLARHVSVLVTSQVLAPGEVLAMVEGTEARWPSGRRLAIVSGLRGLTATPEEAAGQALLEGRFLAELGRVPAATTAAREALVASEAAFAAGDPRTAAATNLLGLLLAQQGDFAAATPLLERTVAILAATQGVEPQVLVGTRSRLGEILRRQGRGLEAREQFVTALEEIRKSAGDAHPALAAGLNDLALVSRDLGRLDEAASFHRQALEIHRRALGANHPNVALDWNNLGSVEQQRERPEEARRAFEEAVAILGRQPEGPPPGLAVALANLAGVLFGLGERDAGCARLGEAARWAEQAFGPDHPLTRDLQNQVLTRCH